MDIHATARLILDIAARRNAPTFRRAFTQATEGTHGPSIALAHGTAQGFQDFLMFCMWMLVLFVGVSALAAYVLARTRRQQP